MHRETEATGMVAWRRPKDITPVEQRRIAPLRARGGLVPPNGSQRRRLGGASAREGRSVLSSGSVLRLCVFDEEKDYQTVDPQRHCSS